MFGFTAKITKRKLIFVAAVLLIPCIIFFGVKLSSQNGKSYNTSAKSVGQRVDFLAGFGWECSKIGETVKSATIPNEFDDVYNSYNEIQTAQGFDLEKYKGKTIKIYTLKILNYPENSEYVYATLMVYDNQVIGGDIHSTAINGFLHGFDLTGTGLTFGQRQSTEKAE